jgi:hypothetical protein
MLSHGDRDYTPLISAIERKHLPLIKLLIENGADPYLKNPFSDKNALERAVEVNDERTINYLIQINRLSPPTEKHPMYPLEWKRTDDCLSSPMLEDLDWSKLFEKLGKETKEELCEELVKMVNSGEKETVREGMTKNLTEPAWSCDLCGEHLMSDGYDSIVVDPCGHYFHQSCLEEHLEEGEGCPITGESFGKPRIVALGRRTENKQGS